MTKLPIRSEKIRWGFLSTAGIAKKNWRAISRSEEGVVRAVASRDVNSAQRFIDECQGNCPFGTAPEAFGSYQAMLDSKDIDAVYIPLPTGIRKEWILAAAKSGKHILAEKPAALSAADVEEILDVCKANGVQYMDGVMFMHSQRLPQLRETLKSPSGIGAIKRIATQFSFNGDQEFRTKNIRSNSQYEPHGSLGDLGWYTIRMILWVNEWRMPTSRVASRRCKEKAVRIRCRWNSLLRCNLIMGSRQASIVRLQPSISNGVTSVERKEVFGSTISYCLATDRMSALI